MNKDDGAFLEEVKFNWECHSKIDAYTFPRLLKLAEQSAAQAAEIARLEFDNTDYQNQIGSHAAER